jgi:hypothetical protein
MTDPQTQVGEDLAYLRTLAREGQAARILEEGPPVFAGPYMALGGALFGTASLLHSAGLAGVLPLPFPALGGIWVASGVIFAIAAPLLNRRTARPSLGRLHTTTGTLWLQAGIAAWVMFLTLMVYVVQAGGWDALRLFPSIFLALYGLCWTAAAQICRTAWLRGIGLVSFATAISVVGVGEGAALWLAYAAAFFILGLAPGLVLMRLGARA